MNNRASVTTVLAILVVLVASISGLNKGPKVLIVASASGHSGTPVQITEPSQQTAAQEESDVAKRIRVENIPGATILTLPVTGSYEKHPAVLKKLMDYAEANYRVGGTCMGIYPEDPEAVGVSFPRQELVAPGEHAAPTPAKTASKAALLQWEVAIRVAPGNPSKMTEHENMKGQDPFKVDLSERELQQPISKFKRPASPFRITRLPATMALVLDSTVERTPMDGLAMFPWMDRNGYVKVGPTRMEIAMVEGEPAKIPTRIFIPVRKRVSGLGVK